MANTVKIRNSSTASAAPSSLEAGELAINTADAKLFWEDSAGAIQTTYLLPAFDDLSSTSHASTHATGGSDPIAPSDIGAAPAASPVFSGTVGIGTETTGFNPAFDDLVVGTGSGNRGITVYGSGSGTLAFADASSGVAAYAGYVQYLHATDELRIGTNSTPKLYIDSSGKVGIQRASPTAALTFSNVVAAVGVPSQSEQTNKIRLYDDGTYQFGFGVSNSSMNIAANGGNTIALRFWTDSTERMRISGTGNVGIGIGAANPASRLDVNGVITVSAGSAAAPALVSGTGTSDSGLFWPAADTVAISTAGVERLRVDAAGRVGIGTASPVSPLHIGGTSEDNIRLFTQGAIASVFTIGRSSSTGALVFKGAQNDYSAYEFRSRIDATEKTVLSTNRLTGATRFIALSSDPASGNEAGDVYYNSTTNKLRVYNGTSWIDLH